MPIKTKILALAATLVAGLAVTPAADAYVYWADSGATIGRANLDGSAANPAFQEAAYLPCGLAVDDSHIWGPSGSNVGVGVGRYLLDGSDYDISFIGATGTDLCGVAVNDTHVYWADKDGYVGRATLAGADAQNDFIENPTVDKPCGVALTSTHVYWANQDEDTIGRALLNGNGIDPEFVDLTAGSDPCGVAVSGTHLYWANEGPDTIGRAPLADPANPEPLINTLAGSDPCAVAVHGGRVYWSGYGIAGVGRANLDGTGVNRELVDAGGTGGCGVAVDDLPAPAPPGGGDPPPGGNPPAGQGSPATSSNEFSFGKPKRNKRKGTARLPVELPGGGDVELAATKKVKGADARTAAAGELPLKVKARGKAKRKLRAKRKVKVAVGVTYAPDGGEPNTKSLRLNLKLKR